MQERLVYEDVRKDIIQIAKRTKYWGWMTERARERTQTVFHHESLISIKFFKHRPVHHSCSSLSSLSVSVLAFVSFFLVWKWRPKWCPHYQIPSSFFSPALHYFLPIISWLILPPSDFLSKLSALFNTLPFLLPLLTPHPHPPSCFWTVSLPPWLPPWPHLLAHTHAESRKRCTEVDTHTQTHTSVSKLAHFQQP